jgi:hypothetical protein
MVPKPERLTGVTAPRALRFALLAVALGAMTGCTSAKPPLPTKPQARAVMRQQGAAMIDSLIQAHGGMEAWNQVVEMTFRGTDDWKAPMDRILNPWPVERAAGENRYRVHDGLGRIQIVTDRGTLTYGIGKGGPWALLRGEPSPDPNDERTASYVVAWHNHLAGLPFRFKEYGAVAHYLGRAHRVYQNQSIEFDEVLVTYPPEGDYWPEDWFVVRIDPISHEMRTMTFTTKNRNSTTFETTCEFSNYVSLAGMRIPTRRTYHLTSPIERELHTWDLADVRFNQLSPDGYFERRSAGNAAAPADSSVVAVDTLGGRSATVVDTAATR